VNAVVLAGGGPDAVSALQPGAPNKAFVAIDGTALVARTLAALRATPRVERIVVVTPPAAQADPALTLADERRDAGRRMLDSLAAGLAGFPPNDAVLVAASDLPVLNAIAVDEFLDGALERDLDLAYAILERREHDARYPQIPHTWARMRDGSYCGGGLVALKPRVLERLAPLLDALGSARKSPLRLAALFGWSILARFALGALRIEDAERRAGAILGAAAGAVRCTHPEVAVNVDRPGDVALANELVRSAAKGA
jgi:molybdopterin-guanine dinucleotide biosynthesis protein A